ncbi:unnamed protein product [Gadus morhua 'NCC']
MSIKSTLHLRSTVRGLLKSSSLRSPLTRPTLLALGGNMLLITNLQIGSLFGSQRSTVMTLCNGAFDSSAVLFLVIKVNVVLTLLSLLAFLHPLNVHLHCRKLASQRCQKAGDYVSS